eukprot:g4298.t1
MASLKNIAGIGVAQDISGKVVAPKVQHAPHHPVEEIEKKYSHDEWKRELKLIRSVYGRDAAVNRQQNAAVLSSMRRHPGLKNNFSGLDSYLGRMTDFDTRDMFQCPYESEERNIDPHLALEQASQF